MPSAPLVGLVAQLALVVAVGTGSVEWQTGLAVRYNVGVMERVARNRGIAPQPCMVAWTHATDKDIGATWLWVDGPAGRRRCLVVDLPQPRDRPRLVRRGIAVELDYRSSRIVCGTRWEGTARECPITWSAATAAIAHTTATGGRFATLTYPTPRSSTRIARRATALVIRTKHAQRQSR